MPRLERIAGLTFARPSPIVAHNFRSAWLLNHAVRSIMFHPNVARLAFFPLVLLAAFGCGDSKTPVKLTPDSGDAGGKSANDAAPSGADSSAPPDAATSQCPELLAVCAAADDVDGLGNLCLRVASEADAVACDAVAPECLAYCGGDSGLGVDAGELNVRQCKAMGDKCHDFDTGSGLGNLCHEVGHTGNLSWCAAIYDECVALCGEPDVPGPDAGGQMELDLNFAAKVGSKDFECGREYNGVGSANSTVTPVDLRFFVSAVRLVTEEGEHVPAVIQDIAPYQGAGVALLDFTDGTGDCGDNDVTLNTTIRITAPSGRYTGVAFSASVPEALNHQDPVTLPSPLQGGDMAWGWLMGYKFVKLELQTSDAVQVSDASVDSTMDAGGSALDAGNRDGGVDAGPIWDAMTSLDAGLSSTTGGGALSSAGPVMTFLHVGSVACSETDSADAGGQVECANGNRNDVVLDDFDIANDVVVFDVAEVVANADLSRQVSCHPGGPSCAPVFEAIGVDYETGAALAVHRAFRAE
jgi:hypothetical protein